MEFLIGTAVRVRGSPLRVTGSGPLFGIAMKAGYRRAIETANEFARIEF